MLLWDELKLHINPAEVDSYARQVGISRITRNEEAFSELATLRQMQNTLQDSINDEIEKKTHCCSRAPSAQVQLPPRSKPSLAARPRTRRGPGGSDRFTSTEVPEVYARWQAVDR
jgi:hypothetical protein